MMWKGSSGRADGGRGQSRTACLRRGPVYSGVRLHSRLTPEAPRVGLEPTPVRLNRALPYQLGDLGIMPLSLGGGDVARAGLAPAISDT